MKLKTQYEKLPKQKFRGKKNLAKINRICHLWEDTKTLTLQ